MRITPLSTNSINYKQQTFSANQEISKQDAAKEPEDSFEMHQENPSKSGEGSNMLKKVCYDKNIFDIEG